MSFDPRITPARGDLAAKHLEGKVTAARFVAGEEREVIDAQAPLRERPFPDAALMTEALMGERVTVYEFDQEGWAWGQLGGDGYVGWLPASALMRAARRADAQGHRAAHARVSRPLDQAAAGRDAAARQPPRGIARAGPLRRVAARLHSARPRRAARAAREGLRRGRRTLPRGPVSVGRQDQSRARLLRPRADRAQRLRHPLPARQRHAGSRARQGRSTSRRRGAAISSSGRGMSRSCATARISFTPTRSTWRSPSSRSRPRSRASRRRAAM